MDHRDHVNLIKGGIPERGGVWADIGAGGGAFTLALAELVGPEAEIHAVDRDSAALRTNERAMRQRFGANGGTNTASRVQYRVADFREPLGLPELDGIVVANALHFQREQPAVVPLLRSYLRAGGRLIVVEYNIGRGNAAVPYPVPWSRWQALAEDAGFERTELLARRPSRFLHEIYSAVSW